MSHFNKMANNMHCGPNHKMLYFDYCETGELFLLELSTMVEELRVQKVNYFGYFQFFMLRPDSTFTEIANDFDVLRLANSVNKDGEIEVFLDVQSLIQMVTLEKTNPTQNNPYVHTEISSGSDDDSF